MPILNRALKGESVIGLLPTGGGKSLTYQIATLLQPGVTMVIDPIKSLMQDQYDNLIKNGIDSCNFINSKLTREEKVVATAEVTNSQILFTFVSPERLQIEEFRDALHMMEADKVYFSYCVIDEVHCVSEWGHDFRTSYLSLGKNVIEHCKTKNKPAIPIFGLTATASFDVLSDVERELSGNGLTNIDTDTIVRFENTNRTELQYEIIESEVDYAQKEEAKKLPNGDYIRFNSIEVNARNAVGRQKQTDLLKIINLLPEKLKILNDRSREIEEWTKEKFMIEEDIPDIRIDDFNIDSFYQKNEIHNKPNYQNGGIIFCPHRTSLFGVTDRYELDTYDEDVYDKRGFRIHKRGDFVKGKDGKGVKLPKHKHKGVADLLESIEKYDIGTFMGSSDVDDAIGKEIETDSFDSQKKFIENERNIMVSTKAFGMGIDKPNVRFTVHINPPSSIESFVQEAGRAGRDRKMALSTILYNKQRTVRFDQQFYDKIKSEVSSPAIELLKLLKRRRFYKDEVGSLIEALGNAELIRKQDKIEDLLGEVFIDKDHLLFFHSISFKGQDKELVIIKELLNEILYPNNNRLWQIGNEISDETGIEEFRIGQLFKNWINFFNEEGKVGAINLTNLNTSSHNVVCDTMYSRQINNAVYSKLHKKYNKFKDVEKLKSWLLERIGEEAEEGIAKRLNAIDFNEEVTPEIIVPFANKYADYEVYIDELLEYARIVNNSVSKKNIEYLAKRPFDDFLQGVKRNKDDEINEVLLEDLKQVFYSPRTKADTDKAIFRLSSIGIIEDYTVDYNKKCYTLRVVKKTDDEYLENLRRFMLKYYSASRVDTEIKKVAFAKGETVLEKCLTFLTNFVYEEIETKRLRSIDDMFYACEIGLSENGNEELKDFIHLYFNSKYAKNNHEIDGENYSLTIDTDNAKEFSFDNVWKYIEATTIDPSGAQKDNVKHLRGATMRLLRVEPRNGALLLLKAYSLFVLGVGTNKNIEKEARDALILGFKLFREKYADMTFEELYQNIERYKNETTKAAHSKTEVSRILSVIIDELYLELHNDWLKTFNRKYLHEYEH